MKTSQHTSRKNISLFIALCWISTFSYASIAPLELFFEDSIITSSSQLDKGNNGNLEETINTLYLKCKKLYHSGDYTRALDHLDSAISLSELPENHKERAKLLSFKGRIFNALGSLDSAEIQLTQAIHLAEVNKDSSLVATSYGRLASLYQSKNEIGNAIKYNTKAFNLSQELNDHSREMISLNNLAILYYQNDLFIESRDLFAEVIEKAVKNNDKHNLLTGLINIGDSWAKIGNLDSALFFLDSSIVVSKNSQSSLGLLYGYSSLASANYLKKNPDGMKPFLDKVDSINPNIQDVNLKIQHHGNLGKYYYLKKDYKAALKNIEACQKYAALVNKDEVMGENLELLVDIHENLTNYIIAFNLQKDLITFTKRFEVFKRENQNAIRNWERQNQLFESEQAIEELQNSKSKIESFLDAFLKYGLALILILTVLNFRQRFKNKKRELELLKLDKEKIQREKDFAKKIERNTNLTLNLVKDFMEGSSSVMAVFNSFWNLVDCNSNLPVALEKTKTELLGETIEYIFPGIKFSEVKQNLLIKKTGYKAQFEHHLKNQNGEEVTYSFHFFKLGRRYGLLMNDVSSFRKNEIELRKAKDDAERALETKTQFLATINHELRTPLNGILGLADLCLEEDLAKEAEENVGLIKKSGNQLLSIINKILDYSKIENGTLEREHVSFDIVDPLLEVVNTSKPLIREKGLECECQLPESTMVVGDPTAIKQIFYNLVSNAVKFTFNGGIGLKVSYTQNSDNTLLLNCKVWDTGIGISEEAQARVFEPFSQADSSTTRKFGGTGLGLAIVKDLIEEMGGSISLQSMAGEGSTFSFSFPIEIGQKTETKEVAPPEDQNLLDGKRILIVEDQKVNQLILTKNLNKWGAICEIANNGFEGISMVTKNENYDIILMDLHMPGMDGVEATRKIKLFCETPVLLLTADTNQDIKKDIFDNVIIKPIDSKSLHKVLNSVVQQKRLKYS